MSEAPGVVAVMGPSRLGSRVPSRVLAVPDPGDAEEASLLLELRVGGLGPGTWRSGVITGLQWETNTTGMRQAGR